MAALTEPPFGLQFFWGVMSINRHLYYFIVGTMFLAFTNSLSMAINLNVTRPSLAN
jgi:hypothetical protein